MDLIVVETPTQTFVVVDQVQGPAGSSSPSGYSSVTYLAGAGAKVLASTNGRNLVLISGITGAMTIQLPNAPSAGCCYVFKVTDASLSVAHTLQLLGNGYHIEFEGSQDAGGANTGPVWTPANLGAIGGQEIEAAADTVGGQWVTF